MAVMSTGSAEVIAVSSIIIYDVYQAYLCPFRPNMKVNLIPIPLVLILTYTFESNLGVLVNKYHLRYKICVVGQNFLHLNYVFIDCCTKYDDLCYLYIGNLTQFFIKK